MYLRRLNAGVENLKYDLQVLKATFSIIVKNIILGKNTETWKNYLMQKYCIYDNSVIKNLKYKKSILLMVNALEILGMNLFCETLKRKFNEHNLVLAVDNFDAYEIGNKLNIADLIIYTPWDFKFLGSGLIKKFNPKTMIFIAKIFHPVLIKKFKQKKILTCLVSGHFRQEMLTIKGDIPHVKRLFANKAYENLNIVSMQSKKYKEDLLKYIKRKNLLVLGDIRHDVSHANCTQKEKNKFYSMFKLTKKDLIIIAAATYKDEDLILEAYANVIKFFPKIKIILVPRHIDRTSEIEQILKNKKLTYTKLSQIKQKPEQIILCDQLVELGKLYSIAQLIIFARTFKDPKSGNANILEPATHGKPIIFGKYLNLFKPFVSQLIKKYPEIQVSNSAELAKSIIFFLENNKLSELVGKEFKCITKNGEEVAINNARFIYDFHSRYRISERLKGVRRF